MFTIRYKPTGHLVQIIDRTRPRLDFIGLTNDADQALRLQDRAQADWARRAIVFLIAEGQVNCDPSLRGTNADFLEIVEAKETDVAEHRA